MAEQASQISGAETTPKPQESPKSAKVSVRKGPKLNERGVPITNWDNPDNDPNLRKHAGEDPEGKRNKLK